ncbi:sn-glycerol-3-phosphate ABC transporter ATP-binding protein UgpC [Ensifer adhaerens]|uniref:ABC transporter ATP-binding protein n=1 Tax=Ensifer adhaerens TaxID=106592 RepID=UPI001CBA800A|nr:sn-glycerol-3-phosphate ABC transporter ATP-binding protein UgpC [Ensifer adhaerens]MBZ7924379.1 sn-glycerol-3-phosphate ABC transporter ATP-binding protein UgpC [Ensifer adhaerens]UAX96374.1 sn-glycerol-3-phosphate ABC transporter ATP-binding protein UgpC [Ensifer adhaerens]UAY04283.1 sn-glycerol-3-phosphate ABC transporter ATP-binding protein UgpC [Ensifer adhaerens]UAY12269.1 sn-glycerol-3-phosphate ABC transporter ATP-binding protein UgpC [Ensifer adhaerens]
MTELTLNNVRKSYGDNEVLHGINLHISTGEFVVFVGPSGCGKSTLLRIIAGLEEITEGTLEFDGGVVNDVSPSDRGIAMVFQSYALYPHMTVRENMGFSMKLAGVSKPDIDRRVSEVAEVLQLDRYLDRLPKQLSGGQRQRVAIGRAIVRDPKVFLFDEPLSNLDAALRVATRIEIAKLHESMDRTTMIYVTHDQVEAMTLADRIVILNQGRIEQIGTPMQLYHQPENQFVAEFIGSPAMNILPCTVGGDGGIGLPGRRSSRIMSEFPYLSPGTPLSLGVRPEDLEIVPAGDGLLAGTVSVVEQLGEFQLVYIDEGNLIAKVDGSVRITKGDVIGLTAPDHRIHLFDAKGRSMKRPSVVEEMERASAGSSGDILQ